MAVNLSLRSSYSILLSLLRLLALQTVPHDLAPTTESRCRRTHPGGFPPLNRARECRGALNSLPDNADRPQRLLSGTTSVINNRLHIEEVSWSNDRQEG